MESFITNLSEKKHCPICRTQSLVKFISLGKMPVANAFLKKQDLEKPEYTYDMEVGFCENCKMVQLINVVPYDKYIIPDETGKTHYAFFSSTSKFMEKHFAEMAQEIEERFLDQGSKVLETGSNDGIMLQAFKNHEVLGVEPSQNVAKIAIQKGIPTLTDFFTQELANKVLMEKGKFRAILSANVTLNIIDLHDYLKGVTTLLDEKGVFVTEDPYILDILEKTSYDQIYDEHIWYFSLTSLSNLYNLHGMEIFDAERQEVHGGSMRVYVCKKGAYEKTERLKKYLEAESQKGIFSIQPYINFASIVEANKKKFIDLIYDLKSRGKKIVGYAAASKGTIIQNYCGIGSNLIDYISDSTPFKQGLYSPGKHIPIVSPDVFHQDSDADYAILFAWNHIKEITEKEKDFIARGGRFIVHLPEPHIVEPEVSSQEEIKGIETKKLNIFANDQGYLYETIRADDKIFDGEFGQILVSTVYPGIIKGLHRHHKQTDYTTCVKGNLKYVAVKENSQGSHEIQTFVIGESNPVLVKTPPGVWHGYTPVGNKTAIVLHLISRAYDPNNPDTERKAAFDFGDVWTPKHG